MTLHCRYCNDLGNHKAWCPVKAGDVCSRCEDVLQEDFCQYKEQKFCINCFKEMLELQIFCTRCKKRLNPNHFTKWLGRKFCWTCFDYLRLKEMEARRGKDS